MRVKKGDKVVIVAGKDSGKIGKIIETLPGKNRVVVEGLNMIVKHYKPSQQMPEGGRVEKEGTISASNVMYYCDKDQSGVRLGVEVKDGEKTRVCKKCGEIAK